MLARQTGPDVCERTVIVAVDLACPFGEAYAPDDREVEVAVRIVVAPSYRAFTYSGQLRPDVDENPVLVVPVDRCLGTGQSKVQIPIIVVVSPRDERARRGVV